MVSHRIMYKITGETNCYRKCKTIYNKASSPIHLSKGKIFSLEKVMVIKQWRRKSPFSQRPLHSFHANLVPLCKFQPAIYIVGG